MTITTLTTANNSTMAATVAAMASGDMVVLAAGTYTRTTTLFPPNGTKVVGMGPATIFTLGANVDFFDIDNNGGGVLNLTNIHISGITFQGNASFASPNAPIFLADAVNCSVTFCTFKDMLQSITCITLFQGSNNRFDYNTFTNVYQGISASVAPATPIVKTGLSVCNNTCNGATRYSIEIQCASGSGNGYSNCFFNNNVTINSNQGYSFVSVSANTTNNQFIGNYAINCPFGAMEIGVQGVTVAYNTCINCGSGIYFARCGQTTVFGNSLKNCGQTISTESGWTGVTGQGIWVGINMINGVATTGASGITNDSAITPPTFNPQSWTSLLALLADGQAAGAISAGDVRDNFGSVPVTLGTGWNTYP